MRILGWTFEGSLPRERKFVAIGYPHTTNWDFFIFLAALHHFDLHVRFLGAGGLFIGPFGWFLERIGGIPVDASSKGALVTAAVDAFDDADEMVLVLSPEGTRAAGSKWKSGFWRIADAADVPVVFAWIDGPSKRVGLGPAARVDGDPDAFMAVARDVYGHKRGIKPANRGPIELER